MAPTKKRKEPPPHRTLMDFFSGAGAIKRARENVSQQLAPSAQQPAKAKVASREVIVIDSDSDDEVYGEETEKESIQLDSRAGAFEDLAIRHQQDKEAFGMPSSLLRSTSTLHAETSSNTFQTRQQSTITPKPDQPELMFGLSAPLLEQPYIGSSFWTFCRARDSIQPAQKTN